MRKIANPHPNRLLHLYETPQIHCWDGWLSIKADNGQPIQLNLPASVLELLLASVSLAASLGESDGSVKCIRYVGGLPERDGWQVVCKFIISWTDNKNRTFFASDFGLDFYTEYLIKISTY